MDRVGQTPGHVLCWFGPHLPGHVSPQGVEGQGGGDRSTRPVGHVAWPIDHQLAPNRLLQVSGAPPRPYKYPNGGNEDIYHILEILLAKLSFLV
jgi:hypothetical protein